MNVNDGGRGSSSSRNLAASTHLHPASANYSNRILVLQAFFGCGANVMQFTTCRRSSRVNSFSIHGFCL